MENSRREPGRDPFLIVGLGNPGPRYAETRHNAGFWFLDALATDLSADLRLQKKLHAKTAKVVIAGRDCILARPTTFMNESGRGVQAVASYFRVEARNMLVAYDELDLPPGTARFKLDGGHGGHNGLRDVMQHIGHGDFNRLRIGIGHPGIREAVTPWVLSRASAEQTRLIRSAIDRALDVVSLIVEGRTADAMKQLHTEPDPENGDT